MGRENSRTGLKDKSGQSLVEFALVVPMLLILVFGIVEFGRAWMTKNILTGAAREASRLAVVRAPYGGVDNATLRANQILTSAGITGAYVNVDVPGAEFGTVTTTIRYDMPTVTPIVKIIMYGWASGQNDNIVLSSSASMRKEY